MSAFAMFTEPLPDLRVEVRLRKDGDIIAHCVVRSQIADELLQAYYAIEANAASGRAMLISRMRALGEGGEKE